jgi:hypothetical protein
MKIEDLLSEAKNINILGNEGDTLAKLDFISKEEESSKIIGSFSGCNIRSYSKYKNVFSIEKDGTYIAQFALNNEYKYPAIQYAFVKSEYRRTGIFSEFLKSIENE